MYYCYLDTPIGELLLAGDDEALCLVSFPEGSMRRDPEPDWIYNEKPFRAAMQQLTEYFAGERRAFDLGLCRRSHTVRRRLTRILPNALAGQRLFARWVPPTAETRSRSSCRVTA
jgi:methylated-DNA-[protein]-cysteine S-methyltransferase